MKLFKCLRCGYEWLPRLDIPKVCAKCKSHYWNIINTKCEICKRTFLKLHTHHINGNHKDNRDENKLLICEDCHAMIHSYEQTKKPSNHHRRIRDYKNKFEILYKLKELRRQVIQNKK